MINNIFGPGAAEIKNVAVTNNHHVCNFIRINLKSGNRNKNRNKNRKKYKIVVNSL